MVVFTLVLASLLKLITHDPSFLLDNGVSWTAVRQILAFLCPKQQLQWSSDIVPLYSPHSETLLPTVRQIITRMGKT